MVEGRSEFVEAMKAASPDGNQDINGDVEDAGGLAQSEAPELGDPFYRGFERCCVLGKKKGGQIALPASCSGILSQDAALGV